MTEISITDQTLSDVNCDHNDHFSSLWIGKREPQRSRRYASGARWQEQHCQRPVTLFTKGGCVAEMKRLIQSHFYSIRDYEYGGRFKQPWKRYDSILKWAQSLEDRPSRAVEHLPQLSTTGSSKTFIVVVPLRLVLPLAMLDEHRCAQGSASRNT